MDKAFFAKYFWDVDVNKIDLKGDYQYVIHRLLDKGDLVGASWILHNYSRKEIVETLKIRQDFSPKSGTFWANYLNVPIGEVACLNRSYRQMRKQLWPF